MHKTIEATIAVQLQPVPSLQQDLEQFQRNRAKVQE